MPTEREAALTALAAVVSAAAGVPATRESDIPLDHMVRGVPRIVVSEGSMGDVTTFLSPLLYEVVRRAEVIIAYAAATEALRDSGIDDVMAAIGAAIRADRQLGGAVTWAEARAPEATAAELDGAARVMLLPVELTYTTPDMAAA